MSEGKKCEVETFSRVCGFFRPIQEYNPGKVSERKDLKHYEVQNNGEEK